jgi:putative membrane protein
LRRVFDDEIVNGVSMQSNDFQEVRTMNEAGVERSLMKGLLAGVIAGLIATAAKSVAERLYAAEPQNSSSANGPAEEPFGYATERHSRNSGLCAADWALGAAAGAAYGALTEYYPAASSQDGKTFGLALMTLTREAALPAEGFAPEAEEQSDAGQTRDAAAHLVFGTVTEQVRSYVRGLL